MTTEPHRVAILEAGPVGLDAALACADAGYLFTLYEAGPTVATHVRQWAHVRLFPPWELNISPRMHAHLHRAGHPLPYESATPTGHDLLHDLLDPLTRLPALEGRITVNTRVVAVARAGMLKHEHIGAPARAGAPFRLLLDGPAGEETTYADLILGCTGTYASPHPLGDGGIPALGERALADRITHTVPDTAEPGRWRGTILLVGAGKSAQTAARDLAGLPGTRLEWAVRATDPDWGEIPDDTLPGRQRLVESSRALAQGENKRVHLRTGTRVTALHPDGARIRAQLAGPKGTEELPCDHVIALTGYSADTALHRQLQIHECYATAAPMNLSATLLGAAGGDCLAQPPAGLDILRTPNPTTTSSAPNPTAASTPSCCAPATSRSAKSSPTTPPNRTTLPRPSTGSERLPPRLKRRVRPQRAQPLL